MGSGLAVLTVVLAACGGAGGASPTSSSSVAATTVAPTTTAATITAPQGNTLPVPSAAPPTTVPPATSAPVGAAVRPPAVEQPDPDDAPPADVVRPRDPNAGDFSSPYGPFGPFQVAFLGPDAVAGVDAAVDAYLAGAVLEPLRTGAAAPLEVLLTESARTGLLPEQRGVLTDEGLPVVADVAVERRTTEVSGIVAPDGSSVANVVVDLAVAGTAEGVPVRTARTGTLTFVLDGGRWRIDAFELRVDRELP